MRNNLGFEASKDSDILYIYDKFTLIAALKAFNYLDWTRRYSQTGEFLLRVVATPENKKLLRPKLIIYKGDSGEAGIIEDISSGKNAEKVEIIEITGGFATKILNRRNFSLKMSGKLSAVISAILEQNFINPTNPSRKMTELRKLPYTLLNDPIINVEYEDYNALDAITELCETNNIGFRVLFNPEARKFDFELYEGKMTAAVFSDEYKNILEQNYYNLTSEMKTTCIVKYGESVQIVNDDIAGFERRETFLSADTDSTQSAAEQGTIFLRQNAAVESFDNVIDSLSAQFPYKESWDLGDVVENSDSSWGVSIKKNVLEVTESYDRGGVHIAPVFGDYIPTALERRS